MRSFELFRSYRYPPTEARVLLLAAHPDDETLGAGVLLSRLPDVWVVHATDGSPSNLSDARRLGFANREEYASARAQELAAALDHCGIPSERRLSLGFQDQSLILRLEEFLERFGALIRDLCPDFILTHPYEGGHPDHDCCALAAQIQNRDSERFEFASYHLGSNGIQTGKFLANSRKPVFTIDFDSGERTLKAAMLDCFRTQSEVISFFPVDSESLRHAPDYDFTSAPHPGPLFYESFDWGISGSAWREAAGAIRA